MDRLNLDFPSVAGVCERCGNINDPQSNCASSSGVGNEAFIEFVTNRQGNSAGFEMMITCSDPGFDQNLISSGTKKRNVASEQCISPQGTGPRTIRTPPIVSVTIIIVAKLMLNFNLM